MVKNPPANSGDARLVPGLTRSLGEGNGNPLHSSGVNGPVNGVHGPVHGVTKELDTT